MCPAMRAHWRNLANTIELLLPSGQPESTSQTANTYIQIDRLGHFLHSSRQDVLGHARPCPSPNNCPFGIWVPLIHASLGPPESIPKRHLDRFNHFCRAHCCFFNVFYFCGNVFFIYDCERPTDNANRGR